MDFDPLSFSQSSHWFIDKKPFELQKQAVWPQSLLGSINM